jgi:hypothetical protein
MLGVKHLVIIDNTMYDAPAYSVAVNNIDTPIFQGNNISVPLISGSANQSKNTDGLHVDGPAINGVISGNVIGPTGDDGIGLNADDGYKPGTGDSNGAATGFAGWTWGSILNFDIHDNFFNQAEAGIRLLSAQSRVDGIYIHNNSGTTVQHGLQFSHFTYPGTGNFGAIDVDGWDVQRGTSTAFGIPAWIYVDGAVGSLRMSHMNLNTAGSNLPYFLLNSGSIGLLSFNGLTINNATGAPIPTIIKTDGTVTNFSVTGTSWMDASTDTGTLIGGTTVPTAVTVSGYVGPLRLLASGYSPTYKNGDAFTNTGAPGSGVGTLVTYLSTTFNEAAAGAALAGTHPTVNTAGNAWADSGNGWTYTAGGGVNPGGAANSFANIDIGVATNYVIRMTSTAANQIIFRYHDPLNYSVVDLAAGDIAIADVVNGANPQLQVVNCTGSNTGQAVLTLTGNVVTVTAGACSAALTFVSSPNASYTKVGFNNLTGGHSAATVTAFSVANQ